MLDTFPLTHLRKEEIIDILTDALSRMQSYNGNSKSYVIGRAIAAHPKTHRRYFTALRCKPQVSADSKLMSYLDFLQKYDSHLTVKMAASFLSITQAEIVEIIHYNPKLAIRHGYWIGANYQSYGNRGQHQIEYVDV